MAHTLISLGSNMGQSAKTISDAIKEIAAFDGVELIKSSSLYKTKPVGFTNQDDFINAAILVDCSLDPRELLRRLLELESLHNRVRTIKNGPRTLDLDIIAVCDYTNSDESLIVPHARMHERAFVLVPCAQIAPDFFVSGHNQSIAQLKNALDKSQLDSVELLHGCK